MPTNAGISYGPLPSPHIYAPFLGVGGRGGLTDQIYDLTIKSMVTSCIISLANHFLLKKTAGPPYLLIGIVLQHRRTPNLNQQVIHLLVHDLNPDVRNNPLHILLQGRPLPWWHYNIKEHKNPEISKNPSSQSDVGLPYVTT